MSDTAPITHPSWLTSGDFADADEPLRLFAAWFEDAKQAEPVDPDAMALSTVDGDGLPNVRMVLLKGFDDRGFVFYTNQASQKGQELAARVARGVLCFIGRRSGGRPACADRWSRLRLPKPMPISRLARACRRSAPGR